MVSKPTDDAGTTINDSRFLTPVESRQDAADRLVGRQTLLALRITVICTAVLFATFGILADPDIVGLQSRYIGMATGAVWVLPGVAGLVAVIVCRRPARRQVDWLTHSIFCSGWAAIAAGGMGVAAGFYGAPLVMVAVCGVSVVCGIATLVLLYLWRTPRVR